MLQLMQPAIAVRHPSNEGRLARDDEAGRQLALRTPPGGASCSSREARQSCGADEAWPGQASPAQAARMPVDQRSELVSSGTRRNYWTSSSVVPELSCLSISFSSTVMRLKPTAISPRRIFS